MCIELCACIAGRSSWRAMKKCTSRLEGNYAVSNFTNLNRVSNNKHCKYHCAVLSSFVQTNQLTVIYLKFKWGFNQTLSKYYLNFSFRPVGQTIHGVAGAFVRASGKRFWPLWNLQIRRKRQTFNQLADQTLNILQQKWTMGSDSSWGIACHLGTSKLGASRIFYIFWVHSGDLNTEPVWYSNGPKEVRHQMVLYLNSIWIHWGCELRTSWVSNWSKV